MFDFLLGGVIGLLLGWNFLPQPQWILDLVAKLKAKMGM